MRIAAVESAGGRDGIMKIDEKKSRRSDVISGHPPLSALPDLASIMLHRMREYSKCGYYQVLLLEVKLLLF